VARRKRDNRKHEDECLHAAIVAERVTRRSRVG
jgi:hypothetical protein